MIIFAYSNSQRLAVVALNPNRMNLTINAKFAGVEFVDVNSPNHFFSVAELLTNRYVISKFLVPSKVHYILLLLRYGDRAFKLVYVVSVGKV